MFPAPAGMSPRPEQGYANSHNVPRTRGDEPRIKAGRAANDPCSPHPRG